jgi:hypothetical protein
MLGGFELALLMLTTSSPSNGFINQGFNKNSDTEKLIEFGQEQLS